MRLLNNVIILLLLISGTIYLWSGVGSMKIQNLLFLAMIATSSSEDVDFISEETKSLMRKIFVCGIVVVAVIGASAITMKAFGAPSSSPCLIETNKQGDITLTACSTKEKGRFYKALDWARTKPTTKHTDSLLEKKASKFYLTINEICFNGKGGRNKPAKKAVLRCHAKLDWSPKGVIVNAMANIKAIKACKGIKDYDKQLNCMIEAPNNGELKGLIEAAIDLRAAHRLGKRWLKSKGCTVSKRGKVQCK